MRILSFDLAEVGKTPLKGLDSLYAPPNGSAAPAIFEAVLKATPGQAASCTVRPIAGAAPHAGYPVGGEVALSGTAGSDGVVGIDGLPFWGSWPLYGLEVVALTGTGAAVSAKLRV